MPTVGSLVHTVGFAHTARSVLVYVIAGLALVAAFVNIGVKRNDEWLTPYAFSVHAENLMYSGPNYFRSDGTVAVPLVDNSINTHKNCSIFRLGADFEKCKRMRSAPMSFTNTTYKWPFESRQMTFELTKSMFLIFLAFAIFWCSQQALAVHEWAHKNKHVIQIIVFFLVLIFWTVEIFWRSGNGLAWGSLNIASSLFVVCLGIMCLDFFDTYETPFDGHEEAASAATPPVKIGDLEKAPPAYPKPLEIIKPKNEHMHTNIYLSYASLLMFPLVVVLILSQTHDAIVDVHIQLVFFSFIFYATLDVFQTRTTAVLLCLNGPAADDTPHLHLAKELHLVKFFVVLAFCLCKCFVLMPALVLLGTQYWQQTFQTTTLAVHYVVLIGFALADLVHITFTSISNTELFKLFLMLVYTCFVFYGTAAVDPSRS